MHENDASVATQMMHYIKSYLRLREQHSPLGGTPFPGALACLLGILVAAASATASAQAQGRPATNVQVAATVLPRTALETVTAPSVVHITEADINRGFIEVSQPVIVALTTNLRRGARMLLVPIEEFVSFGVVNGLPEAISFSRGPRTIHFPRQRPGERTEYRLTFRLYLREGAAPGEHFWPVQLYNNEVQAY